MKQILITNDDGYNAKGLLALKEALLPLANIIVVAPAKNKSACSHSITLDKPLRMKCIEDDFYVIDDGTPADCVYISINNLFKENYKPDLIISGINKGANMGEDITYSGTVGACMEGVLQGIPSIAISQVCKNDSHDIENNWDYELAKKTIYDITKKILNNDFPLEERKLFNINIPPITLKNYKGIKITKAGYRNYGNDTHRHLNPRGEEFYWIGLHPMDWEHSAKSDFDAINEGYVSLTPIKINLTSCNDIKKLEKWIGEN